MKKYIIFIALFITFALAFGLEVSKNRNLETKYEVAVANNKAYEAQLDSTKKIFQFTVDQLNYLNDSTINELDSIRRVLKIKDNQIKQMSRVKEYVYIKDTIRLTDTVFKDPDFVLDTCLGDNWYHNHLHMEYPSDISSLIEVNLENDCFIYTNRETINPPCKTWIGRLFQKKHTVINVTVKENNPYVNIKESKFVKIVD